MGRIELSKVSLTFHVRQQKERTSLKSMMVRRLLGRPANPMMEVRALQDVNLRIKAGERVGIFGHYIGEDKGGATALAELPRTHSDGAARKSHAHILGFALAAVASDAFPIAGMVAVPVVQAAMLRQLAKLYGVGWNKRDYAEFAGALGTGTLVRVASGFGVRQLV